MANPLVFRFVQVSILGRLLGLLQRGFEGAAPRVNAKRGVFFFFFLFFCFFSFVGFYYLFFPSFCLWVSFGGTV